VAEGAGLKYLALRWSDLVRPVRMSKLMMTEKSSMPAALLVMLSDQ
jgi:hypothetical protein